MSIIESPGTYWTVYAPWVMPPGVVPHPNWGSTVKTLQWAVVQVCPDIPVLASATSVRYCSIMPM